MFLNHIDQEITLMTIADYLNISKNYFCSLFKQETGYNFFGICHQSKNGMGEKNS